MNTNPQTSIAIIWYVTLIGFLVALNQNQSKKQAFIRYHLIQSFGLILTAIAFSINAIIPILGRIIYIKGIFLLCYMWVESLMNAIKERKIHTPILGAKYIQWLDDVFKYKISYTL